MNVLHPYSQQTIPLQQPRFVIKLRGLPWKAREQDVRDFFYPTNPMRVLITFLENGKASGEGYVEFYNSQDLQNARLKDKQYMGNRYVEIFASNGNDYDKAYKYQLKISGQNPNPYLPKRYPNQSRRNQYQSNKQNHRNGHNHNHNPTHLIRTDINEEKKYIIRIRGLPFDVKENEIYEFFGKIPIGDIVLLTNKQNTKKLTGEGFVFLKNKIDQDNTRKLDKAFMNKRYIEIFESSIHEFEKETKNNNKYSYIKYNKNDRETTCLHVNGLPNNISEQDISNFFSDSKRDITPWKVYRKTKGSEAFIEFHSIDDCNYAYKKDKAYFPHTRNTITLEKVSYDKLADTIGLNY